MTATTTAVPSPIPSAFAATSDHSVMPGRVVLHVPGEAPDLLTATAAAHRHAAEVLDEYPFEIDVEEHPAF